MNIEKYTFILCFLSVLWRRIFLSLIVYSKEKNIDIDLENILKCFKYNLFAPTGFVENLRPYVIKALTKGFLMPNDFSHNIYVKKAIHLFSEAYVICKIEDEEYRKKKEKEFIINYCCDVFKKTEENRQEALDITKNLKENSFSDLVDIWDIDFSLIISDDPYLNLIKFGMLSVFF